jgi:hypothetical protein
VPLTSNEPDISAVKAVLEGLLDEGKKVVVVVNSYGITPACEAVKVIGFEERKALGKPGGVIKLIFVSAWLMREEEHPPMVLVRYKMESAWVRFDVGRIFHLNDMAKYWPVGKQLLLRRP